jgi:hypothetical protein
MMHRVSGGEDTVCAGNIVSLVERYWVLGEVYLNKENLLCSSDIYFGLDICGRWK